MKEIGTFASCNGVDTIQYYVYTPEETSSGADFQPRAILQISHGMCEFIERYEGFAKFLAEQGIVVFGNDHLGHGSSVKSPEGFGFFAEENGWKHLVDDLRQMTVIMKQRYPGVPVFLLGHSMGSFLARIYISWYAKEIDGAIIMGTSGSNPALPASFPLVKSMIAFKGKRYRSELVRNIAFGTYNKKFKPQKTKNDWLSSDEGVVETYNKDPRCTFIFTLQGFLDLFSMLKFVTDKQWAQMVPANLPVFLVSGAVDPVGQYGKGVREVHDRLALAGVKDLRMKLYEGCRHEILNERNRETVYQDILRWIETHIEG
ncbi:MAG: lysophospholipase [Firmicutes bacterium]|nr:lysophospholipase [Bacillota bacterium]